MVTTREAMDTRRTRETVGSHIGKTNKLNDDDSPTRGPMVMKPILRKSEVPPYVGARFSMPMNLTMTRLNKLMVVPTPIPHVVMTTIFHVTDSSSGNTWGEHETFRIVVGIAVFRTRRWKHQGTKTRHIWRKSFVIGSQSHVVRSGHPQSR